MRTVFLRVLEAEDKREALRQAVILGGNTRDGRFGVDARRFASVPRAPFAYWVSDRLRGLFARLPAFESEGRESWVGLQTNDDYRWLRLWCEVAAGTLTSGRAENRAVAWVPYAKGGNYAQYYSDIHLAVAWGQDGRALKSWKLEELRLGRITANNSQCWNESKYFRRGYTWSQRSQVGLSVRAMPEGVVFGIKGPAVFWPESATVRGSMAPLALLNSAPFLILVSMQMAFGSYDTGVIRRTPVPLGILDDQRLDSLARAAWRIGVGADAADEASRLFEVPPILRTLGFDLESRAAAHSEFLRVGQADLMAIQAEIDEHCFRLYDIAATDQHAIAGRIGTTLSTDEGQSDAEAASDSLAGTDWGNASASAADARCLVAGLISWGVGVAFGRFDIRLATGHRQPPPEPDPFDPLPPCSPGMLSGDDGLPVLAPPAEYPISFPPDGILVDDAGHPNDVGARVREVFDAVFGDDADARWQEAGELVDPRSRDVRQWLARDFFPRHLRMYSKSRRKAPIYWQLATPSASYSVWLYYHRFTRDTLFRVLSEYVSPKLRHEERRLTAMTQHAGQHPTPAQRREIAAQEAFVEELRALRDELGRVAPLWNPDLDDGVIINCAPLWRLSPHHKAWQREVKACWDKLSAGDYDWAHLAMHLWPERVVAKCAQDRSLAIAHGLEDALWVEDAGGKWRARDVDPSVIEHLVAERSSPSVKAALADLLAADGAQTATTGRGRRR